MTRAVAAQALASAARVGEFFAVELDPDGSPSPLRTLLTDSAALDDRVVRARRSMADSSRVAIEAVPVRTAASVDQLALVARLLSPALGACAIAGIVPELTPDNVAYRPGDAHLAVTAPTGHAVRTSWAAAAALGTNLIDTVIGPLLCAYAARFHVPTQVLWGNVASALNGTVEVLDASGIAQQLPARDIAMHLLRTAELAGTVRSTRPRFIRNSCCLWYRIPGSAVCGDCVLSA